MLTTLRVPDESAGARLDRFLAGTIPGLSRSRLRALIDAGAVHRNHRHAKPSERVRVGDLIAIDVPDTPQPASAAPEEIPLAVLYEDASIVVLDKPAGLVVHPGAGNRVGTLVNALLHHCGGLSSLGGAERPGIVHRLDKETSGCIVVAKDDAAHRALSSQFASRAVEKTYLAIVDGRPRPERGLIDQPIARHRVHRKKMAVAERGGRAARTDYRVLASDAAHSLVECKPHTGRTHQIRVHLKSLGTPVTGDPVYGRRGGRTRHLLHAWKLAFDHPVTARRLVVTAPIPDDFFLAPPPA